MLDILRICILINLVYCLQSLHIELDYALMVTILLNKPVACFLSLSNARHALGQDRDELFLEQVGTMDRANIYLVIDYITSNLKEKSVEDDIFVHSKWVSFRTKTTFKVSHSVVSEESRHRKT